MKKYIKRIALFVLPVVFLGILMEILERQIPNDYSFKMNYLDSHAKDIQVITLGSSHGFYDINPEFLSEKAFNASHVAQSLDYDYFIFERYRDKLKNLKVLVLPISNFSLFYRLEEGVEQWRAKNYAIYYHCNYHPNSLVYNTEILNGRISEHFENITNYYLDHKNNVSCSSQGFGLNFPEVKREYLPEKGKVAASRHLGFSNRKYLKGNLSLLETMIKECKVAGVQVILVTPPAWKTYRENFADSQVMETAKICNELVNRFSNVSYYSFYADGRFAENDFGDADHLNSSGAKKFTQLLDTIIQSDIKKTSIVNNMKKEPVDLR